MYTCAVSRLVTFFIVRAEPSKGQPERREAYSPEDLLFGSVIHLDGFSFLILHLYNHTERTSISIISYRKKLGVIRTGSREMRKGG